MNAYEAKQEARRERLEARADKLRAQSTAAFNSAKAKAEMIPFGQPILVGHYSEKRDRNFRAKITSGFRKAFELDKAAGEAAARADAVGTGGISSDDPDAVVKLREKLVALESAQSKMVAANKVVRAFWKVGLRSDADQSEENQAMWSRYVSKMAEAGIPGISTVKALLSADCCGRIGYADFQLTNNGAEIRRVKARISALEKIAAGREAAEKAGAAPVETIVGNRVRIVENIEANRLQMFFPGKPSADERSILKGRGFRWAPSEGAWQRQLNNAARYAAREAAKAITGRPE